MFHKKKRCPYCVHVLGEDGYCQNEKCKIGQIMKQKALEAKAKKENGDANVQ